jgi:hypothetical protein
MARIKGGKLTVTYDTTKPQPLDSRMLVTKYADLINPTTWQTNGTTVNASFNGMMVAVNNDTIHNGIYYLTNKSLLTADNYTAYQAALTNGEETDSYFKMWIKLAAVDDLPTLSARVDGGEILEDSLVEE